MSRALVKVSIESMGRLLHLPNYLELEGAYLDTVGKQLILVYDSDAIPEEVTELRPIFVEEVLGNPQMFTDGGPYDWENAKRIISLKEIQFFSADHERVN
jgi:hypothetical protein